MKTALQELMDKIELQIEEEKIEGKFGIGIWGLHQAKRLTMDMLEKEKEQLQVAFSDGQETPINHPTLPHYSREEYFNDNYNQNK